MTRRTFGVAAVALGGRLFAAKADFWNRKDPAQWTAEEIGTLLSDSPWARPTIAFPSKAGRSAANDIMRFNGVVRWESAAPVREALKAPLPEAFANAYVIAVSGFPILGSRTGEDSQDLVSRAATPEVLERIQAFTYLEPKGKPQAQPGVVRQGRGAVGEMNTLLFGFSKEAILLSREDREVVFYAKLMALEVRAKFNFKDMVYRGQLAV